MVLIVNKIDVKKHERDLIENMVDFSSIFFNQYANHLTFIACPDGKDFYAIILKQNVK